MKTFKRKCAAFTGLAGLLASAAEAVAHPGSHVGADHNHFLGGGEVLLALALIGFAVAVFMRRR